MKRTAEKSNKKGTKNKMLAILKWAGIVILAIIVLVVLVVASARLVNWCKYRITTPNGIEESTYIELGGQQQYIQIRGEDKNNPLILFLHGGPASPHSYVSHRYQSQMEDEYTFVNWDQRGSGRTYFKNVKLDAENESVTAEQIISDLDELVDYLCERFGQEKVIILGHSWGTIIGSEYARIYPEKVAMYIGVGQVINCVEADRLSYEDALAKANAAGNEEDAKKLEAAWSKLEQDTDNIKNMLAVRALTSKYHKYDGAASTFDTIWSGISSPYMSIDDIRWFFIGNSVDKFMEMQKNLVSYMMDWDIAALGSDYAVPVCFITGEEDWITPAAPVREYMQQVNAPSLEIVTIENTGHSPFMDNAETYAEALERALSVVMD